MGYEAKNFDHLIGMQGFGEQLLKNHFTLYQGYVTNTNKLSDLLTGLAREGKTGPEYGELERRFGWEWNGMRLHELYFENLGGDGVEPKAGKLWDAIGRQFDGWDNFRKSFLAAGAMRGIGWVALYQDPGSGRLLVSWINEHDAGHLAGAAPLLIMDVFEHAFMLDYGLKRADYLAAFWKNLDWKVVEGRMK